jgi:D-alanine--poly(phosphoribitol) ligase subunit 2
MENKNRILQVVLQSIDEINEQMTDDEPMKKELGTIIYGKNGTLDSLGLINLVVAVEQNIEDEFSIELTLADERAMSQESSPFRTIDSLVEYIKMLIEEQ